MELYNLFSVPVLRYTADESYDDVQCEVKKALSKYDNFKRSYDFIEKYDCKLLKDRIEKSCLSYLHHSRWSGVYDKSQSPVKLENSWVNFGKRGESHKQHVHPGHKISGVYYFRVSREQGSIVFQNPNPVSNTCEFPSGQIFSSFTHVIPYDGDIILYVVDLSSKSINYDDLNDKLKKIKVPLIIVLNKIDKVDQQILEDVSKSWSKEFCNAEIWTVSALKNFNIQNLKERIVKLLPEGPKFFPDDQWTDKSERFFVNEIIREKIFKNYKDEIPYSSEVITEKFKYRNKIFRIYCSIIVERNSQKAIIIGNKGLSLKNLASQSRVELEKFFNQKVFLEINVKVLKDWRKKVYQLKNFGYN